MAKQLVSKKLLKIRWTTDKPYWYICTENRPVIFQWSCEPFVVYSCFFFSWPGKLDRVNWKLTCQQNILIIPQENQLVPCALWSVEKGTSSETSFRFYPHSFCNFPLYFNILTSQCTIIQYNPLNLSSLCYLKLVSILFFYYWQQDWT